MTNKSSQNILDKTNWIPALSDKRLPPLNYAPPDVPLKIIYEDNDLLVLSKPSGILSVPGARETHKDSLQNRVLAEYPHALLSHRLDMETSGVFVMPLNKGAHVHVNRQFELRRTQKTYIARVFGHVKEDQGLIDLPLCADWEHRPRQHVDLENGRNALTDWRVLERESSGHTRIELKPITGRSHQLRVHMQELGYPILGEVFYAHDEAKNAADRLQLHAQELTLYHPHSGDLITFKDPAPF